jgi:hypothetical protein
VQTQLLEQPLNGHFFFGELITGKEPTDAELAQIERGEERFYASDNWEEDEDDIDTESYVPDYMVFLDQGEEMCLTPVGNVTEDDLPLISGSFSFQDRAENALNWIMRRFKRN